ncbi:MAG TPA: glycosyl hydrolase family 28 protein [Opitutaceae bacterium]|nr:glycosyl hydrolase family 28 protein [Opitutaceae bacterium]
MNTPSPLSRRQWLGQVAAPVAAASFATTATAAPSSAGLLAGAHAHNVRDHGARGDGSTLDTAAVQAAIDAAHAARGGVVLVPAGDFVVGTLELKSHVTLHLAAQGRLLGSPDIAHYRPGRGIPPGNGNIVLLSAHQAENVAIEGPGTIDGNGAKYFTGQGDMTGPGQDSRQGYFQRPHLLIFHECRGLRMRDVFLTASAYHGVRILRCEHVTFDGVRIHNRVNKNNDGFHFNSCRYVHVSNCDIKCQDDACALFGSNQFVTVANSTFSTRWSVFRFGGGEPANIAITNCVISDTFGCPIKMRFGAGSRARDILFSNLVFSNVTGPISIGLDSQWRGRPGQTPPTTPRPPGSVRHIAFHGIRGTVAALGQQYPDMHWEQSYRDGEARTCIVVNGANQDVIENISFSDVHLTVEGGGTAAEAAREVPEMAGEYFEIGTPPAYGLYARGVRGLTLQNVRLETTTPDARPAVVFDRVTDATVNALAAQGQPAAASLLRFRATRDVLLSASRVLAPAAAFLRVEGAGSGGIVVDGGDLIRAARAFVAAEGAPGDGVHVRD